MSEQLAPLTFRLRLLVSEPKDPDDGLTYGLPASEAAWSEAGQYYVRVTTDAYLDTVTPPVLLTIEGTVFTREKAGSSRDPLISFAMGAIGKLLRRDAPSLFTRYRSSCVLAESEASKHRGTEGTETETPA